MKKLTLLSIVFWQFGTAALALTPSQKKDLVVSRAIRLNDAISVETFYAIHSDRDPNRSLFLNQQLELKPYTIGLIKGHEGPAFRVLLLFKKMHVTTQYKEPLLEDSSPLHMALRYLPDEEGTAAVFFLLKGGVHPNLELKNAADLTPKELAEKRNHPAASMIEKFEPPELRDISSPYIPQAYFQGQKNLSHYAEVVEIIHKVQSGKRVPQDLNEKQANALVLDSPWRPILHETARLGQKNNLADLLEAGADLSSKDALENRVLHYAAQQQNPDILRLLLNLDVYLNPMNVKKETPLHLAMRHHQWDNAILLLQKGANGNLEDQSGSSPKSLFLAAKKDQRLKDSQKIQRLTQLLDSH